MESAMAPVMSTVTEDITGAIADSINYAVDALRGLVTTINGSAIQLESATRQTQALSQHLARASGAQSRQVAPATEIAASMAGPPAGGVAKPPPPGCAAGQLL